MLKEEFAIYQDTKNNKTTIVVRNMSKKTFDALTQLLLGDIKTVNSISGLEEVASKEPALTDDVSNMQQVTSATHTAPSMADPDNAKLYYPQDATATAVENGAKTAEEIKQISDLWLTYDDNKPAELMQKFLQIYMSDQVTKTGRKAAGQEIGNLLVSLSHDRRKFCSIVWGGRNIKEFATVCMKLMKQKGCGDGLTIGTEEYSTCVTNALYALADDELMVCATAIAKQFVPEE